MSKLVSKNNLLVEWGRAQRNFNKCSIALSITIILFTVFALVTGPLCLVEFSKNPNKEGSIYLLFIGAVFLFFGIFIVISSIKFYKKGEDKPYEITDQIEEKFKKT